MFLRVRTYKDDELYAILREVYKAFDGAQGRFDLGDIARQNNIVNSSWALDLLSFRLRCLCESILACTDYYSASILYRALIEHLIKHTYIFVSCVKNGDDIGAQYVSSEHMSYEILLKLRKSRWPDNYQSEAVRAKPNEFKEFRRQAKETLDQFAFGEVTKSLLEIWNVRDEDVIKEGLRHAIVEYSRLSSYVHAGPLAVLDLEEKPKTFIDSNSIVLTMMAHMHTIGLASLYPSEHQEELKTLVGVIHEKIDKAMAICNERITCDKKTDEHKGGDKGQKP